MSTQAFILAATSGGPMLVNRFDFNHAPDGKTAYGVGAQLLASGAYDAEEILWCRRTLTTLRAGRGDKIVALDCGANIGVHTLAMAQHMEGWGNVLAFEAQERVFYALCGNIALNNLWNAHARKVALAAESGTLRIPQPDYCRPASFGSLELQFRAEVEHIGQSISYASKDMVAVNSTSLDDLHLPRADFIKLDVEGMELGVLEGASTLIKRHRPVMLIEWIKSGQEELRDFLAPFGYEVVVEGANLVATPK